MTDEELKLFKKHINLADFDGDDDLIAAYWESALESVVLYTHRTQAELEEQGGGTLPAPLRQAVRVLAASFYSNRESTSPVQLYTVPDSLHSLLKPYRKLADDPEETEETEEGKA